MGRTAHLQGPEVLLRCARVSPLAAGPASPRRNYRWAGGSAHPRSSSRARGRVPSTSCKSLREPRCLDLAAAAQIARDEPDQEEAKLRVFVVELEDLVAGNGREAAIVCADRRHRAYLLWCEEADLAEHVPG